MEILKLVIPFTLGLIPFIIKLIVDFKSDKESLKEMYRIKFYERQLEIFNEIADVIQELNSGMFSSTFRYGYKDEANKAEHQAQFANLSNNLNQYHNLIQKNGLFIPTSLLIKLNSYWENSVFLLTPDITMETNQFRDEPTFTNRDELNAFFNNNNNLFNDIIISFRLLIGVDKISKDILKKVNNSKYNYRHLKTVYRFGNEPFDAK